MAALAGDYLASLWNAVGSFLRPKVASYAPETRTRVASPCSAAKAISPNGRLFQ